MLTNTKLVLAAVLLFAGTSAVLANDIDESASSAQADREWQTYMNSVRTGHAGNAFGYVAPNQGETAGSHKQSRNR